MGIDVLPTGVGVAEELAPELTVVKVGGSLVSRKDRAGDLDIALVVRYARLMAELWVAEPGRVVLVVGGGAIGHGAVRVLDPADPFAALDLTRATFTVKWEWVRALRARGVRCFPIQVGGMCVLRDDDPAAGTQAIDELLRTGALPILSGDCVVTPDGALRVFGSDRVPQIFVAPGAPRRRVRVVVLTDVPGVLADGPGGRITVPYIDPDDPDGARRHMWPVAAHDASGAMGGKVEALQALARAGAECVILRGDAAMSSLDFLTASYGDWAGRVPHTLIARRGPARVGGDRPDVTATG